MNNVIDELQFILIKLNKMVIRFFEHTNSDK